MRGVVASALWGTLLVILSEGADIRLSGGTRLKGGQVPSVSGWVSSFKSMVGWGTPAPSLSALPGTTPMPMIIAVMPSQPPPMLATLPPGMPMFIAPTLAPAPYAYRVAEAPPVVPPSQPLPSVAVRMMAARQARRHPDTARAHVALHKHHARARALSAPAAAPPPPVAAGAPGSAIPKALPAGALSDVDQEMADHLAGNAEKEVEQAAAESEKESREALEEASKNKLRELQMSQSTDVESAEHQLELAFKEQLEAMRGRQKTVFDAAEHNLQTYSDNFFIKIKNNTVHLGAQAATKYIGEAIPYMGEHIHDMKESSNVLIADLHESIKVANTSDIQAQTMTIKAKAAQKEAMTLMNQTFYQIHVAKRVNNETSIWVTNATKNATKAREVAVFAKERADEALNKVTQAKLGASKIKKQVYDRAAKITGQISAVAAAMEQAEISATQSKQADLMLQEVVKMGA